MKPFDIQEQEISEFQSTFQVLNVGQGFNYPEVSIYTVLTTEIEIADSRLKFQSLATRRSVKQNQTRSRNSVPLELVKESVLHQYIPISKPMEIYRNFVRKVWF